ncbi:Bro-N domain-containing protein [Thiorhodospira sibirica]|uniref:BRO-N domain-containing protein n=1 Tax=Thiorhodospira sibirica TaxID=154347 RepID=UPI00022C116D|nr:BRO family protein [Thiorhodospira sibirica]
MKSFDVSLIPFRFELFNVRVVITDGVAWFVAKDVALVLGYTDTTQAIRHHCKYAKSLNDIGASNQRPYTNQALNLDYQTKLIPESDVYRLILRSKLPSAERFQDWVTEEVLPTIRQTGAYHSPTADPLPADLLRAYIRLTAVNLYLTHLPLDALSKRQWIEHTLAELGITPQDLHPPPPPPQTQPSGRDLFTLSALLSLHQQRHSVQVVNRALVRLGWLQDIRRETPRGLKRVKQLVGEGLCYGRNQCNQPLYYAVQFPELLRRISGYLR